MGLTVDSKRAKTVRGRRALAKRDPKVVENPRTALVLRGQKSSAVINAVLLDLYMLKKPHAVHFKRSNAVHPFEDATPLEFMCQKNDASIFAFGNHSKKRPHNLVLGRCFDHHVLDMVELSVDAHTPLGAFPDVGGGSTSGSKPCLLFSGADWEHSLELQALRGLLIDFFHLEVVSSIASLGIEHALVFTAWQGKVLLRHYVCRLLKSAEATSPHVALTEIGPSMDLRVRRSQPASDDVMKQALQQPKASAAKPKKEKNVTRSKLLGKQGQLHVPRQDLTQMATARMKAFRKPKPEAAAAAEGGGAAGASEPRKRAATKADEGKRPRKKRK